ncbi:MAG: haloalkane dehalogenase, partial [Actinomycetota bacterium]|nr:haloalkane dehalogenase [Actinomycetota bacterium]
PEAFAAWQQFSQEAPTLPVGRIVAGGCATPLPDDVVAAYDAPFPDESYKEAARQFPVLVPTTPDDPGAVANRAAWQVLEQWDKPLLTAFSDGDPITRGGEKVFQDRVPGAQGQAHVTIEGAGHFLQEDKGEELAQVLVNWVA